MNTSVTPGNDWRDLFAPERPAAKVETLALRVARRRGADWLILPALPKLAARSLALYPAQTVKARWARQALALALRLGLKPGLQALQLSLSSSDPFVAFLRATATLPPTAALRFALLAGNPNAFGRRFVILLFGAEGQPAAVVKAGATDAARHLLAHEVEFLQNLPTSLPGVPRLRGNFQAGGVRALALDCFPGDSPSADDTARLGQLLGSWLVENRWTTLEELPAWKRLLGSEASPARLSPLKKLAELRLHPTIMHGDLAPWNIKSAAGRWMVLDWERGEISGVPGWDWFHFVLQPALLVQRESPDALLRRCEAMFASPDFKSYAERAGIAGHAPALALGYLLNCLHVTQQTEGGENLRALLELAAGRWVSKA